MLAAKPIIATDALGINDVISSGHDGLLVAVSNPSALSEAICQLLSNKELAHTLGEQARQTVLTEYSLDRMIDETTKVYLELVKHKEKRLATL
jgi:glycosyltransferase involved in cell wall biosynthesis